ncbi:uncharacterized protein LOC103963495 isoform X2 [Pyrus x bretschneideri]|uniref:uncharacterized protein LOC103963495 isoform X2 n=1 Tax=Pyrus x bretschneideri TaxID=225117 RepID=UPI0008709805|nr:uncharacterized protein LOC103963495 isoform X2 [Pyrus x bretschneideri]
MLYDQITLMSSSMSFNIGNLQICTATSSRPLTNHTHLMLKANNGFWAPFDHNTLLRTCSLLLGSPSSSAPPPCGGTSIYMGAHKDDWIITLAQFAVDQHNHKEILKNFMELLVWNPVNDRLSVHGVKCGY